MLNQASCIIKEQSTRPMHRGLNGCCDDGMSMIVHDLREPLAIVKKFADVLLEEPDLPQHKRDAFLKAIARNADQLLKQVEDLHDLAAISSGRFAIDERPFRLREFFEGVEFAMAYETQRVGLQLKTYVSEALPEFVVSDPTRLAQILQNLLGNALRHTKKGGITITADLKPALNKGEVHEMVVRVADSGQGIEPFLTSRIFDAFVSTKQGSGLQGLGLSISRAMARALGGDLLLESTTAGLGSVFKFTIPIDVI